LRDYALNYGGRQGENGLCKKDLPDMNFVKSEPEYGGIKIYTRNNDMLKFGDLNLSSITYYFWRDRFYQVKLERTNFTHNDIDILGLLREKYGGLAIVRTNPDFDMFVWPGYRTRLTVIVSTKLRTISIEFRSEKIYKMQKDFEDKRIKRKAQDLY
jgi:hypothetical protein